MIQAIGDRTWAPGEGYQPRAAPAPSLARHCRETAAAAFWPGAALEPRPAWPSPPRPVPPFAAEFAGSAIVFRRSAAARFGEVPATVPAAVRAAQISPGRNASGNLPAT